VPLTTARVAFSTWRPWASPRMLTDGLPRAGTCAHAAMAVRQGLRRRCGWEGTARGPHPSVGDVRSTFAFLCRSRVPSNVWRTIDVNASYISADVRSLRVSLPLVRTPNGPLRACGPNREVRPLAHPFWCARSPHRSEDPRGFLGEVPGAFFSLSTTAPPPSLRMQAMKFGEAGARSIP